MMNYIGYYLIYYLVASPFRDPNEVVPKTPWILDSAHLFRFFPEPIRFHLGFFVAILVAVVVWILLFKTTWGYESVRLFEHEYIKMPVNIQVIPARRWLFQVLCRLGRRQRNHRCVLEQYRHYRLVTVLIPCPCTVVLKTIPGRNTDRSALRFLAQWL